MKSITKRSTKHFTKAIWSTSLAVQNWEDIGETENLEEMTGRLTAQSL